MNVGSHVFTERCGEVVPLLRAAQRNCTGVCDVQLPEQEALILLRTKTSKMRNEVAVYIYLSCFLE